MSLTIRNYLKADDGPTVRAIVEDTGFFRGEETLIAVSLVEETLARPEEYSFLFAEDQGRVLGYLCYSEIPGTVGSYEIYWLAVRREQQGRGIGRGLVTRAEAELEASGARKIYISTSGSELYQPTRAFYERCGYQVAATLKDFYRPGDDQIIFLKNMARVL